MRHQPDRTRHNPETADDLPRKADLATDGTDRARGIERQHLPGCSLRFLLDEFHERDVSPREPVLLGNLKQPRGARIDRLVDRMADTRNRAFLRAKARHDPITV